MDNTSLICSTGCHSMLYILDQMHMLAGHHPCSDFHHFYLFPPFLPVSAISACFAIYPGPGESVLADTNSMIIVDRQEIIPILVYPKAKWPDKASWRTLKIDIRDTVVCTSISSAHACNCHHNELGPTCAEAVSRHGGLKHYLGRQLLLFGFEGTINTFGSLDLKRSAYMSCFLSKTMKWRRCHSKEQGMIYVHQNTATAVHAQYICYVVGIWFWHFRCRGGAGWPLVNLGTNCCSNSSFPHLAEVLSLK